VRGLSEPSLFCRPHGFEAMSPQRGAPCKDRRPEIFPMKNKQSKRRRKPKTEIPYWIEKQRKINEPAPFTRKWSAEEKESILDYMHGETARDQVKACCYYEYARASETLRKARREYNPADPDNSLLRISRYFTPWILNPQRFCFLQCKNFPNSPWRDLSETERKDLRLLFKCISHWPIITDVRMLDARRIFDDFKQQAEELRAQTKQHARTPEKSKVQTSRCPAIIGDSEIKHVVITIDYRDGVQAKKEQFGEWLASGLNRKLFDKHYKRPKQDPESVDHHKELLKFLAAWRLYDEFVCKLGFNPGLKAAKDWTRKNRREDADAKDAIRLKPFFRERLSKRLNVSPLYKERRQWEKEAIDKAKDFLAREIEFGQSADVG
jgi:hypothetical protein